MSGTVDTCSIAVASLALVAAGGVALYSNSNIPHMKDRIGRNESDVELLCEELSSVRREAHTELYQVVSSLQEEIETLNRKLNAILDILQKTGVDVESFKKVSKKRKKHRKEEKDEDPDAIIALVRGGRK